MKYKKILILLIILFIAAQFIRIDTTNPETDTTKDYRTLTNAPSEISGLLKNSCYDCHSNTTKYPWYSKVAPVSWFLNSHIQNGRRHLNFSEWGNYTPEKRARKIEACITEIEENEMPLSSYTLIHTSAKLTKENKSALIKWFRSKSDINLSPE